MAFRQPFAVRTIQDIREIEAQCPVEAIPARTTYQIFENSAQTFAERPALSFIADAQSGEITASLNFCQLLAAITRTANAFYALGVGKTDAVSILLPGCMEYHFALWGGSAAGIAAPLNPLLSINKLGELVAAAGARVLVGWSGPGHDDIRDKALALSQQFGDHLKIVWVGGNGDQGDIPPSQYRFTELLAASTPDRLISSRVIEPSDIAAYFHTGGTTGSPKLAQHTHANQVFTAWASVMVQSSRETDVVINGYPLFHVAGTLPGALTAFSVGAHTIIPTTSLMRNPTVVANYWQMVAKHRVTIASGVPTMLAALAEIPLDGADISSVRFCRTGAAPLPGELKQRFHDRFGINIQEALGMTETAGISTITPPGVNAPAGCVGLPMPHAEIRIVATDADGAPTDTELGANQPGLVLYRAPNLFPGYLDQRQNQGTFTPDGFLITGDIGFFDQRHLLHLCGRAKDLIIRSGHNIDPRMIEEALATHPAVELCAAVGQPDAYAGELPVAFAVLRAGTTVTERELLAHVEKRVDEAPARPKSIAVIPEMPVTNVGKIYKPELRRMAVDNLLNALLRETFGDTNDSIAAKVILATDGKISASVWLPADAPDKEELTERLARLPIEIEVATADA